MTIDIDALNMRDYVRQSNLIEDIDDPGADLVGQLAWLWLSRHRVVYTHHVKYLHFLVTILQDDLLDHERGEWRTEQVYVGDHVPPISDELHGLLVTWCDHTNLSIAKSVVGDAQRTAIATPAKSPRQLHVEFEKIHPFIDGNGRVGRLLMWWHEAQLGRQPTLLLADERQAYYRWFR